MTKEQKALLELIRIGSSGVCNFSEALANADWQKVHDLVGRHGVTCLGWHGVELLFKQKVDLCPHKVKIHWCVQSIQAQIAMAQKRAKSLEFVRDLGLPCVILKGIDYCRFWPKDDWRTFGDLDIWLQKERYDRGNQRARAMGCRIEDDGYYKHSKIFYNKLMIENHMFLTMFDETRSGKILESALQKLINKTTTADGQSWLSPSNEFTALFILVHAHQHFFFDGFSLKQILDWHFFLLKEENNVDWNAVLPVMEKAHVFGFYNVMTAFCVRYLGLKTIMLYNCSEKLVEDFCKELFSNGDNAAHQNRKASQLIRRFKRMWRFRMFLGESIWIRIRNTYLYNYKHKKPTLK